MKGPSFRDSMRNFWESDEPFLDRCRLAIRNNAIKTLKRRNCCGNHGEPGC